MKIAAALLASLIILLSACAPVKLNGTSLPASSSSQQTEPIQTAIASPSPTKTEEPTPAPSMPALSIEEELRAFLLPYVAARGSYVSVAESPDEEAMYGILHFIMNDAVERNYYKEQSSISELAAKRTDDWSLYVAPEQLVRAAGDYLGWEIAPEQIVQHYADQGKAYYQDESHDLSEDNLVIFLIGDGDMHDLPCITSVEKQGDRYVVKLCAAMLDFPYPTMRTAQAVIEKNPDSVFGYTLISYEDQPLMKEITASSARTQYPAKNIMDDDPATAWVPERPISEWIELQFGAEIRVAGLRIYSGYGKSGDLLEANNRVKLLRAELPDGTTKEWDLPDHDIGEHYWNCESTLLFDAPVLADSLRITVLEVYPGGKYDDTCISEFAVIPAFSDAFTML